MRIAARLQLLTFLLVYVGCVQSIMVKFGTKEGPIEPPTPEPSLPPPQPYRDPAPVWEERIQDAPDPNAQWRPPLFVPQPRYTQVIYNTPSLMTNAQRFVNAYRSPHQPVQAQPVQNLFTPSQVLSSQSLPGIGLRYFVPNYIHDTQQRQEKVKEVDTKYNEIETNEVDPSGSDSYSDLQWKYEKDAARRLARQTPEAAVVQLYQWSYVPLRHH